MLPKEFLFDRKLTRPDGSVHSSPKSEHMSSKKDSSNAFSIRRPPALEGISIITEYAEIEVRYRQLEPPIYARTSKEVNRLFRSIWADDLEIRERFYMITVNNDCMVLGFYQIGSGGVSSTAVDPKLIFGTALRILTCTGIMFAHNHPSGNPLPSAADRRLTNKFVHLARLFNMNILEHLILTSNGYFSFSDTKLLPRPR